MGVADVAERPANQGAIIGRMDFEWDPEKAVTNLKKQGVSFHEAASVLGDPMSVTFYDPDHSTEEDRYISIGRSSRDRLIIVSHCDGDDRVRIISARTVTRRERKIYENG